MDYLTSGRWSPTRPGVIITGRADGSIDVWDLVDQCHRPSLSYSLGGTDKITSMEFWQGKAKCTQPCLLFPVGRRPDPCLCCAAQGPTATGPTPLGPQYMGTRLVA